MQIIEYKRLVRKRIKEIKNSYSKEELNLLSDIICNKVLNLPQIKEAKTVFLYHALPDEVQTISVLNKIIGEKRVVLPVVVGDDLVIKEYIPSNLKVGYMNILEPAQEETVNPQEIDLAIVPGIAFDSKCNRLGRGKGYYDRLLPKTNCTKIGICYNFQLVDNIPADSNDIPMDIVITDCNEYSCKQEYPNSCDNSPMNF